MNIKSLFAFASAVLLLAACSNNDEAFVNSNFPEDGVIRVMTNVGNPETRAGMTTDDIHSFFLNIENETDANYSYYAKIFRFDTGDWNSYVADGGLTPLTMLWKNSATPVIVTAISREGRLVTEAEFNTSTDYSVSHLQTTDNQVKQDDILYMKPTEVDPASDLTPDGKLTVSFVHLFSKINLTVTLGTELNTTPGTATNPITEVKVNGASVRIRFKASTNEWGAIYPDLVTSIEPYAAAYTAGSGNTQSAVAKYEMILPPQTIESGKFSISFNLDGKPYQWTSSKAVKLESGKQHALGLTVGRDVVTTVSFTAQTWGNSTDGGSLETE